jgi:hypothetical protein
MRTDAMHFHRLLAASLALAALSGPITARAGELSAYDFCAESPLAVGSQIPNGATVTDIHVIANSGGYPVGWIYATSRGDSYLQTWSRMPLEDQHALHALAGEAVSDLRPKPNSLPPDLAVRACRPSEIARF